VLRKKRTGLSTTTQPSRAEVVELTLNLMRVFDSTLSVCPDFNELINPDAAVACLSVCLTARRQPPASSEGLWVMGRTQTVLANRERSAQVNYRADLDPDLNVLGKAQSKPGQMVGDPLCGTNGNARRKDRSLLVEQKQTAAYHTVAPFCFLLSGVEFHLQTVGRKASVMRLTVNKSGFTVSCIVSVID
jgi:hypothetical protein